MALGQRLPRQRQHPRHDPVGQPGQPAGAVDRAQPPVPQCHRDAEPERLPGLVQGIEHRLDVAAPGPAGTGAGGADLVAVRQRTGHPGVQQFVQQQRVLRQALGQQCAVGDHVQHPLQRIGLLVQQGQVGAAAQDVLHHRQQPAQRQLGLPGIGGPLHQRRQHPVQARPAGIGQSAHARAAGEIAQQQVGGLRLVESGSRQLRRVAGIGQRTPVAGQRSRRSPLLATAQQGVELRGHEATMPVQLHAKRGPVPIAEAGGDPGLVERVDGQGVDLVVAQHLQPVFQPAQVAVGTAQRRSGVLVHLPRPHQRVQGRQQPTLTQGRLPPPADQLQGLDQELDLADPARAALDVVGQLAPRDLGADRGLHRAQAIKRAEVEVAPVDEGTQHPEERLAGGQVPGDRTRLLPGVALPVAAFLLEVQLHRRQRPGAAPGAAVGPQAQVDPVAEAIGGVLAQQPCQLLPQAVEIRLRRQRAGTVAGGVDPFGVVAVDQVDVGTEVELASAQLAQGEYDQPPWRAIGAAQHAVAAGEVGFGRVQGERQARLGETGAAGKRVLDAVQAEDVAPGQPRRLRRAMAAQHDRPLRRRIRSQHRRFRLLHPVVGQQAAGQAGLCHQGVGNKVTGGEDAAQARVVQRLPGGGGQAGQAAFDQGFDERLFHRPDDGTGIGAAPERRQ